MSYQSFIRQCQAGQGWLKGGSIVYTVYDTEQGVMIGVLDGREDFHDSQAFWCPDISDDQGLALTRRLYEEGVSLEQVPYVLSDMQVLFRMTACGIVMSSLVS
mgnify:FL=1